MVEVRLPEEAESMTPAVTSLAQGVMVVAYGMRFIAPNNGCKTVGGVNELKY